MKEGGDAQMSLRIAGDAREEGLYTLKSGLSASIWATGSALGTAVASEDEEESDMVVRDEQTGRTLGGG